MSQRLLVFGDSFTVGQGLDPLNQSPTHADPNCWAFKLAEMLNLPCENQACCGSSNKHIWHFLTNTTIQKNDIVIVAWSVPDRHALIKSYASEQYPAPNAKNHNDYEFIEKDIVVPFGPWHIGEDIRADAYYHNLYYEADALLSTYLFMDHATSYVERNGGKILHLGIPFTIPFEKLVGETTGDWDGYNRVMSNLDSGEPDNLCFVPHWAKHLKMPLTMTASIRFHGMTDDGHMSLQAGIYFAQQVKQYMIQNNYLID